MLMLGAFLLAAFVSASQADPDALVRAEKLLAKQDYKGAEAALRDLLRADPSSARAHGNLALALLPQGKLREAVDEGRLAAAFGPDLPEARYIYGMALRADGRPLEAAREFEKVLALKPGQAGALRALAAVYAAQEDPRTVSTYEKLVVLEPDKSSHRADLAEYLWRSEKAADGNRVMVEAITAFPEDRELRLRYGRALFEQERHLDAAVALEKARGLGSRDVSTLVLLGKAYWEGGKTDAAVEVFEAARGLWPSDPQVERDCGRLLLTLGRAAEALPPLEEAARLQPNVAEIRLDLGSAYESLGRLAEAEASYRLAAKLSPNSYRAHYALGHLLLRQGNKAEAERELAMHRTYYENARRRFSENAAQSAEVTMAWAELNQGKTAQALERFSRLPESPDSLLGWATALSRQRRHREAVVVLERARKLDPENHGIESLLTAERSRAEEEK